MKPCLEFIHGSTSRIDDVVAGLLALLRKGCVIGEEVTMQSRGSGAQRVTVVDVAPGLRCPISVIAA